MWYLVACAWIVTFVVLVLGAHRIAQVIAALAIVPDLVRLLQGQFTGALPAPSVGPWAFWVSQSCPGPGHDRVPPRRTPAPRRSWLLALPANYLLVAVPLLAVQATGNHRLDAGLFLGCTASWSPSPAWRTRRGPIWPSGSGVWSLTLALLAAVAGATGSPRSATTCTTRT